MKGIITSLAEPMRKLHPFRKSNEDCSDYCAALQPHESPLRLSQKLLRYLLVVGGVVPVQAAGVRPPTLAVAAAGQSVVAVRGQRGDLVPGQSVALEGQRGEGTSA